MSPPTCLNAASVEALARRVAWVVIETHLAMPNRSSWRQCSLSMPVFLGVSGRTAPESCSSVAFDGDAHEILLGRLTKFLHMTLSLQR